MEATDFKDYRSAVESWLSHDQRQGARSRLAQAIGCSPSWLTRVLAGEAHLTPDQSLAIAEYFGLSEMETDYFLVLVDLERSASPQMQTRLRAKQKELLESRRHLRDAVKSEAEISDKNRIKYYSSWLNAAAHTACMIKPMTTEELSLRLAQDVRKVGLVLAGLKEMGLVENADGRWRSTSKNVHLTADDPVAKVAHTVYRNRTTQQLQENPTSGLHYSALHCLSQADAELLRKKIRDFILECRQVIDPSPSETMAVLCVDWYEI